MGVGRMSGGVAPAEMPVAMVMRLRYGDLYLPTGDSGLDYSILLLAGKMGYSYCTVPRTVYLWSMHKKI